MKEYIRRYFMLRRHNMKVAIKKAKMSKMCYAFLAPYAIIFALFYILPVITSIFYSFTYYNILESPKFVGLQNYINLILQDDVFLIGVKNTFVIAVITGPLGYIARKSGRTVSDSGAGYWGFERLLLLCSMLLPLRATRTLFFLSSSEATHTDM